MRLWPWSRIKQLEAENAELLDIIDEAEDALTILWASHLRQEAVFDLDPHPTPRKSVN